MSDSGHKTWFPRDGRPRATKGWHGGVRGSEGFVAAGNEGRRDRSFRVQTGRLGAWKAESGACRPSTASWSRPQTPLGPSPAHPGKPAPPPRSILKQIQTHSPARRVFTTATQPSNLKVLFKKREPLNVSGIRHQNLNLSIRRHLWLVFFEITVEFDNALLLYKVSASLAAI